MLDTDLDWLPSQLDNVQQQQREEKAGNNETARPYPLDFVFLLVYDLVRA